MTFEQNIAKPVVIFAVVFLCFSNFTTTTQDLKPHYYFKGIIIKK